MIPPTPSGYYVASEMDPTRPATIVVVNSPRVDMAQVRLNPAQSPMPPVAGFTDEAGDGSHLGDMKHMMDFLDRDHDGEITGADFVALLQQRAGMVAHMYTSLDFYKGIVAGLIGNPANSIADVCGLVKGAVKVALKISPLEMFCKVVYEFIWGDKFEAEIATAKRTWDTTVGWVKDVAQFVATTVSNGQDALISAIMQGRDLPGTERISKLAKVAIDTIFMLLVAGEEAWDKLTDYNKGYGVGYVCAEIVIAGVAALLTAEAGGAGALVTLGRNAPKLLKVFELIGPAINKLKLALAEFTDVAKLFDRLIEMLGLAKAQKWCFVAGTSVMTMTGPLPIEQIHAGMMVWSAPESGTEAGCFRPVLETYQNRAPEVWRIAYDHDRNPAAPDATLTASGGHPVWVEELQKFVPARDLQPGEHLRLAIDGGSAQISHITRQRAPPGGIPVFNLAVAEYHTYFAGTGGVWVHNLCTQGLEKVSARFNILLEKELKSLNGAADAQAYERVAVRIRETIKREQKLNDDELVEGLSYAYDQIRKKTRNPRTQWDETVEALESRRDLHMRRGNAADDIRSRHYETLGGHAEIEVTTAEGASARLDNWIPGEERISRKDTDRVAEMLDGLKEFNVKYHNATIDDTAYARLHYPTRIGTPIDGEKILEIRPLPEGASLPARVIQEARAKGIKIRDYEGNVLE